VQMLVLWWGKAVVVGCVGRVCAGSARGRG
jgi:hypothetical protein